MRRAAVLLLLVASRAWAAAPKLDTRSDVTVTLTRRGERCAFRNLHGVCLG